MKYVKQQLDINKTIKDHATNRYTNKSGRHWSNLSKPYQTHSPFYRSLRRRLGKGNADLTNINLSNEI